jgi:hypothetical protein
MDDYHEGIVREHDAKPHDHSLVGIRFNHEEDSDDIISGEGSYA